jgi:hypothetical protein
MTKGEGRAEVIDLKRLLARDECQTARNRDPGSASKRAPFLALVQACPGSEQEGPARVA